MTNGKSLPRNTSGQEWPDLGQPVDLIDSFSRFAIVERMAQAAERGENPLECCSPEWS